VVEFSKTQPVTGWGCQGREGPGSGRWGASMSALHPLASIGMMGERSSLNVFPGQERALETLFQGPQSRC